MGEQQRAEHYYEVGVTPGIGTPRLGTDIPRFDANIDNIEHPIEEWPTGPRNEISQWLSNEDRPGVAAFLTEALDYVDKLGLSSAEADEYLEAILEVADSHLDEEQAREQEATQRKMAEKVLSEAA